MVKRCNHFVVLGLTFGNFRLLELGRINPAMRSNFSIHCLFPINLPIWEVLVVLFCHIVQNCSVHRANYATKITEKVENIDSSFLKRDYSHQQCLKIFLQDLLWKRKIGFSLTKLFGC